jgi:hypothetical protein
MLAVSREGEIGPHPSAAHCDLKVALLVQRCSASARETHGRRDASGPRRWGVEQREDAAGGEDAQRSTHRDHLTGPQPRRRRGVLRGMRIVPVLAAVALACASTPPPRPAQAGTPTAEQKPELPRSSIAAILVHREDLALTPMQVETLARRDDALAREDEALRARVTSTTSATRPTSTPSPSGGRAGRHGARRPPAQAHAPDTLTQLDDNDTRAYLEIEEQVLTEAQRPRAREIASAYREALYDQQHPSTVHGRADAGSP